MAPRRMTVRAVLTVALALATAACADDPAPSAASGPNVTEGHGGDDHAHEPAGIDGVVVVPIESNDHTTDPVTYDADPPAGGPHHPRWLACGVYEDEVPNENAVHALEHGAVWITYRDLSADDVDVLASIATSSGRVIVSPYPTLEEGEVVASAWGYQLRLTDVRDARLEEFVHVAVDSPEAPEPGASCA